MRARSCVRCVAILTVALGLAAIAGAQDRVAQLSEVSGAVTVTRAAGGSVDEARQIGPRVQNGSVFTGDVVATGPGATATMVFSDSSVVKLKEKTTLSVRQVDFAKLMAAGQAEKPLGRVIQITTGDIWTHIVPNATVATEFETPSGVAAVKGTTLTISVSGEGSDQGTAGAARPQGAPTE